MDLDMDIIERDLLFPPLDEADPILPDLLDFLSADAVGPLDSNDAPSLVTAGSGLSDLSANGRAASPGPSTECSSGGAASPSQGQAFGDAAVTQQLPVGCHHAVVTTAAVAARLVPKAQPAPLPPIVALPPGPQIQFVTQSSQQLDEQQRLREQQLQLERLLLAQLQCCQQQLQPQPKAAATAAHPVSSPSSSSVNTRDSLNCSGSVAAAPPPPPAQAAATVPAPAGAVNCAGPGTAASAAAAAFLSSICSKRKEPTDTAHTGPASQQQQQQQDSSKRRRTTQGSSDDTDTSDDEDDDGRRQPMTKTQLAAARRRAPEVDWRSIKDPAERRRQRRLAKNRVTAARSRERKKEQWGQLSSQLDALEQENARLRGLLQGLLDENTGLREQAASLYRGAATDSPSPVSSPATAPAATPPADADVTRSAPEPAVLACLAIMHLVCALLVASLAPAFFKAAVASALRLSLGSSCVDCGGCSFSGSGCGGVSLETCGGDTGSSSSAASFAASKWCGGRVRLRGGRGAIAPGLVAAAASAA